MNSTSSDLGSTASDLGSTSSDLGLWTKNVLESLHSSSYHPIENHTLASIHQEIVDILAIEQIEESREIQEKLKDYRYVGEICDLFRGRHIRWIRVYTENVNGDRVRIPNPVLTNGGIVTDIKFQKNGIYIQCKNPRNQFMLFKFDHCILFQKLTAEECVLLMFQKDRL